MRKILITASVLAACLLSYYALGFVFTLGRAVGTLEQKQQPFRFTVPGELNLGLPQWGTQVNDSTGKVKRA